MLSANKALQVAVTIHGQTVLLLASNYLESSVTSMHVSTVVSILEKLKP